MAMTTIWIMCSDDFNYANYSSLREINLNHMSGYTWQENENWRQQIRGLPTLSCELLTYILASYMYDYAWLP